MCLRLLVFRVVDQVLSSLFVCHFSVVGMEYLRAVPPSSLATDSHRWFAADIFTHRPRNDVLPALAASIDGFKQKVEHLMRKPTNHFTDVRLYTDVQGSWMVFGFDRRMRVCNVKVAIDTLQAHSFPPESILGKTARLSANLHTFDELDKERLEAMQPITGFRPLFEEEVPKGPKFELRTCSRSEGNGSGYYYERVLPDTDSEDENALAITPAATLAVLAAVGPVTMSRRAKRQRTHLAISDRSVKDDAQEDWAESVRETVAVAVVVGENVIEYTRCIHEDRRQKILAKRLDSQSTPFSTVMAAHALVGKGVFSGYMQKQGCMNDIFQRPVCGGIGDCHG